MNRANYCMIEPFMKLICFLTFGKEKQAFSDVNNDNTRYFDKS